MLFNGVQKFIINYHKMKYLTSNHLDILRQRTRNVDVKKYCVKLLDSFGSFEHTRKVLTQLDTDARTEVENLGGNPLMIKILDGLKTWSYNFDETSNN